MEGLTFEAVPRYSSEQNVLGTGIPGWISAAPKALQNRSSVTNFDRYPHIRAAFFFPRGKPGKRIVRDSLKTTSTLIVSLNGYDSSRPFPNFY